jgi:DNA-directed RNA polymerase specialized sigma24 family protein
MDPVTTTNTDALKRIERCLQSIPRTQAHRTLTRWRAACPELRAASLDHPTQLKPWLRQHPASADQVLAHLVRQAQQGDSTALLVTLACLAPGIRNLTTHTPNDVDEVLSEVALGIVDFPVDRRTSIAGGLLLDARNRLHRSAQRATRTRPLEETDHPEAPGDLGHQPPPDQRAVQLVCQAHRQGLIDRTEAKLILHTRVGGHPVKPIADHLGLSPSAAYQRRHRAETRLTELVA